MCAILQFEVVRSFSFRYAKQEAAPVRNCCWKEYVSVCLTVYMNMNKFKSDCQHVPKSCQSEYKQMCLHFWATSLCSFLQASRVDNVRLCNISETQYVYLLVTKRSALFFFFYVPNRAAIF